MPGKFVLKKGTTGKFRFNLLSTNGQVVVTSQTYNSKASAMGGIRSVKKLAGDAPIEDHTITERSAGKSAMPSLKAGGKDVGVDAAKKSVAKKAPVGRKKR